MPGGDPDVVVLPLVAAAASVNAYLIPAARALIDPGPDSTEALTALEVGLGQYGLSVSQISAVLLTHSHQSHAGLARAVREASGAAIMVHPDASRQWSGRPYRSFLARAARAGGVPAGATRAAVELEAEPVSLAGVTHVADGQLLSLGGNDLSVIATPGHAAGHVAFHLRRDGSVVTGDVLLRDSDTRLPLEPRFPGASTRLDDLVGSWRAIARLPVEVVLPGHGSAIRAHRVLIARRMAGLRQRLRAVRGAVALSSSTLWDIVVATDGAPDPPSLFDSLGQTAALLEWLVARGQVERSERSGVAEFQLGRIKKDARGMPGHPG